jgi:hypothetical protein
MHFTPSWYWLKDSVAIQNGLLLSHSFMNNSFHFLLEKSATPVVSLLSPPPPPQKSVDDPEIRIATTLGSLIALCLLLCGSALSCTRISLATDNLFVPLKQQLVGRRFHRNWEVETVLREYP